MKDNEATISAETAAQLLMCTSAWIRKLAKDGWITRSPNGKYTVVNVVQGYLNYLKDNSRRASRSKSTETYQAAKTREVEARTAEREHKLLQQARLAAISEADQIIGGFVIAMNAIPARVTRDVNLRKAMILEIEKTFASAAENLLERKTEVAAHPLDVC